MAQEKRRAKPKKPGRSRIPEYLVHCGDAWNLFAYGGKWKVTHLTNKLNELLARIDFLPGLVLRDEEGKLLKPVLQVHLVPVDTPEER